MIGDTSHAGCVVRPVGMSENITVLVTGASGTSGAAVGPRLSKTCEVRPMSRRARAGWVAADLRTGDGLADAVRGADVIVHLASSPVRTADTDIAGTRRLLDEAKRAGVRHLVFVSINGADRVPFGYYRAKIAVEDMIKASGVPYTILRAAQFHQFAETLLTTMSKLGPVVADRKWLLQPVSVEDVADRIADLIDDGASDRTVEFAGPQVLTFEQLARPWLAARGRRRPVWAIRIPGRMSRAIRAGGLTTEARPTGTHTWEDYLAAKY